MPNKASFTVQFDLPKGAKLSDGRAYIQRAVMSECGNYPPDHPMHNFDRDSVRVILNADSVVRAGPTFRIPKPVC